MKWYFVAFTFSVPPPLGPSKFYPGFPFPFSRTFFLDLVSRTNRSDFSPVWIVCKSWPTDRLLGVCLLLQVISSGTPCYAPLRYLSHQLTVHSWPNSPSPPQLPRWMDLKIFIPHHNFVFASSSHPTTREDWQLNHASFYLFVRSTLWRQLRSIKGLSFSSF